MVIVLENDKCTKFVLVSPNTLVTPNTLPDREADLLFSIALTVHYISEHVH